MATCRDLASASLYTATVSMPRSRAVLITRHAISPRLAINRRLIGASVCEYLPQYVMVEFQGTLDDHVYGFD